MKLMGKRVNLGHGNVSLGTREMRTLCCTITLQKMLMVKLSKTSTICCVLPTSKLLSAIASLTFSKPDLVSIFKLTKTQFSDK